MEAPSKDKDRDKDKDKTGASAHRDADNSAMAPRAGFIPTPHLNLTSNETQLRPGSRSEGGFQASVQDDADATLWGHDDRSGRFGSGGAAAWEALRSGDHGDVHKTQPADGASPLWRQGFRLRVKASDIAACLRVQVLETRNPKSEALNPELQLRPTRRPAG